MSWQSFHLKQHMTHTLPHYATERQQSVNNIWSCILGNHGLVCINALIAEPLTASMAKYATYRRKITYSKIIHVADCKTPKKRLLAVKYLVIIIYTYPTAKSRTVYKSTDGPAGWPSDNPPNSDRVEDLHRTVPELIVQVYWIPGLRIWQQCGSDLDLDLKWRSRTNANTTLTRNDCP
jgi:hypothetical protein